MNHVSIPCCEHWSNRALVSALVSPQLYPSLCELAHVLSVDGPVRQRLDSLAGELAKAADKELQVSFDITQKIFSCKMAAMYVF